MAAKLGRYVFRRIGGRIVPIRVGAEAATMSKGAAGISKKTLSRVNLLLGKSDIRIGKTGKLLKSPSGSGTDSMLKFMDKTGAVRFSRSSDSTMIDVSRKMSAEQRNKLASVAKGEIYVDVNNPIEPHLRGGSFKNFMDAYRRVLNIGPKELKKPNEKMAQKAVKTFGTTSSAYEAGYIMRDGRMLDFSGKRHGGPSGVRYMDHREIAEIVRERSKKLKDKEVSQLLRDAQRDRKRVAESRHEATTLKREIGIIRKEFISEEWAKETLERMESRLSKLKNRKK